MCLVISPLQRREITVFLLARTLMKAIFTSMASISLGPEAPPPLMSVDGSLGGAQRSCKSNEYSREEKDYSCSPHENCTSPTPLLFADRCVSDSWKPLTTWLKGRDSGSCCPNELEPKSYCRPPESDPPDVLDDSSHARWTC